MKKMVITPDTGKQLGRILYYDGICYLGYSASEIGFYYNGNRIIADILTDDFRKEEPLIGWIGVFVGEDETPWKRIPLEASEAEYLLFDREEYAKSIGVSPDFLPGELAVRIVKYSEAAFGVAGIRYLLVEEETTLRPLPARKHKIEFIGDSITCGYGIEGVWNVDAFTTAQENPMKDYALLTAGALDADYQLVSWSGIGIISDYIPPEVDEPDTTVLMQMLYPYTNRMFCDRRNLPREEWDFTKFVPDVVVLHLGTNDASYTREKEDREAVFAKTYKEMIATIRSKYPKNVHIVCCLGIMDHTLCKVIDRVVKELAAQGDERIRFVELDMQKETDGIGADWHPSETTHKIAAAKLTEAIRDCFA